MGQKYSIQCFSSQAILKKQLFFFPVKRNFTKNFLFYLDLSEKTAYGLECTFRVRIDICWGRDTFKSFYLKIRHSRKANVLYNKA